MTSADTESSVTITASFFVVPASRSECASTRAPTRGSDKLRLSGGNYESRRAYLGDMCR